MSQDQTRVWSRRRAEEGEDESQKPRAQILLIRKRRSPAQRPRWSKTGEGPQDLAFKDEFTAFQKAVSGKCPREAGAQWLGCASVEGRLCQCEKCANCPCFCASRVTHL